MNLRTPTFVFFILLALSVNQARGQQIPAANPPQNVAATLPDSSEGLQKQIAEILNAIKEKNSAKEAELMGNLLMPEDSTWFTDEYGPGFGNSLLVSYRLVKPELAQQIRDVYEANVGYGWMSPKILRYDDPEKTNSPIDHFLNSMNKIVPLYQTAFQGDRPSVRIKPAGPGSGIRAMPMRVAAGDLNGYYVFVQGRFRFIPADVLGRLPNERPVRIRLDMNVLKSKVISRGNERFPEEFAKKHISGNAVVHVVLDMNGKIQDAKIVSGDPLLGQTLLDNVKQWQFLPTQLDGDPVEVEFDVETFFKYN